MDEPKHKPKPFSEILVELLDLSKPFSPVHHHQFSDLSPENLNKLKEIWSQINLKRRVTLLEDLEALAEADTHVCFDNVARFALSDDDATARKAAIALLWECEDRRLIPTFIAQMENDESEEVRAAAAAALGLFVYLGELEEIPEQTLKLLEDSLLAVVESTEPVSVRKRALESLGYSSRDEVYELLLKTFESDELEWNCSAIYAIGRSADSQWEPNILKVLDHPNPQIQFEAIRSAGQLELSGARQPLEDMLETPEVLDEDVRIAAIVALSSIGGKTAAHTLERLAQQTDDEDEVVLIVDAIDHLKFTDGHPPFDMFGFNVQSQNEMDHIEDLSGDEAAAENSDYYLDEDEGSELDYFYGDEV